MSRDDDDLPRKQRARPDIPPRSGVCPTFSPERVGSPTVPAVSGATHTVGGQLSGRIRPTLLVHCKYTVVAAPETARRRGLHRPDRVAPGTVVGKDASRDSRTSPCVRRGSLSTVSASVCDKRQVPVIGTGPSFRYRSSTTCAQDPDALGVPLPRRDGSPVKDVRPSPDPQGPIFPDST